MKLNFNENLVRYRKRAGLTQQQLAQKLSITPQAVSKWEKGSYPDCELLPKLSQILDVSLDVLFGLKDEDVARMARETGRSLTDMTNALMPYLHGAEEKTL